MNHAIGRQEELVVDRAQTGHRVTLVRQAEPFCVAAGLVGRGAAAPHAPRVADVCAEAVVVGRAAMMWQQARRASSRGRVAATAAAAGTLACAPAWWTSSRRPAVLWCVMDGPRVGWVVDVDGDFPLVAKKKSTSMNRNPGESRQIGVGSWSALCFVRFPAATSCFVMCAVLSAARAFGGRSRRAVLTGPTAAGWRGSNPGARRHRLSGLCGRGGAWASS